MNSLSETQKEFSDRQLTVTRTELPALLGCGQQTADKVAKAAQARIFIGRRLLISIKKVENYLDSIAE